MKRIIILLGIVSLLFTVSCKKYFDQVPQDRLSLAEIFNTRDGVQKHLAGVYTYIPDEFNQRQLQEQAIFRTPGPWTAAGDETEYPSGNKAQLINNNTLTATEDTFVKNRWKSWYIGIREATVFMDNVYKCPTSQLSVENQNQWRAEARALRAIYYFYLVRAYGPVPLIKGNFTQDTPSAELQLPRNTVDECFNFIVSELKAAQQEGLLVHVSQDRSGGAGRIDQSIAQAFIIEALTFRASWLFNGSNAYYSNMANPDGTKLFPQNASQATAKWLDVINESKQFLNTYVPTYYKLERVLTNGVLDPYKSYRTATRGSYSEMTGYTEMIFYRIDNSAATMQYDRTPNHKGAGGDYRGGGFLGATQEQVDAYFMDNGLPPVLGYQADGKSPIINGASGYVESGTIATDYKGSGTDQLYAPAGSSNMYYKREPRFYADVTFNNQKWLYNKDGNIYTSMEYSGNAGKLNGVNDYSKTGYVVRKCAPEGPWGTGDRVCILLRLPQVYFNYVEALCQYDPTNPDIWKYVNEIRERAGIPQYGSGSGRIPAPTGKENIMKAIMAEKRVEMSFENTRYFDLRRWGMANEYLNKPIYGMNVEADGNAFYNRTKVANRTFAPRQYFFPIPQKEIDVDKNLVQNNGY
ncbi:RagB/SusD family nutrient uptake outer membrane protein [Pedobacter hiemivivus]|uniref:RagB/SusD family nutrient uptake outer membrane protein n=1 Tax=Pedobacter hiemivivus TaxID=2530454 RepID=A0A4R0NBZ5_9SPHI|nr:RagB/SusD family nutrient uptake outer membrane protein [Pedobacter hiemivivus]TCC96502.1 RagB/SusD family nutrient uptake outer membrane protein [Pedobacter hiemivivus]